MECVISSVRRQLITRLQNEIAQEIQTDDWRQSKPIKWRITSKLLFHLREMCPLYGPDIFYKKSGTLFVVLDGESRVNDCISCASLIDTFLAERPCIVIGDISAVAANWMVVNCSSSYGYICEASTAPETGLQPGDFAAIGCGIFLVVSFIVVMIVDLIKNPAATAPKDTRPIEP
ncbi:uncharacterized protein LOC121382093 isoform X1 [Gigantopelta aegis]|uniref:uncharacterized protein LOC121382093 isoform X1 n=1 Tax=Gigantopelta aegis TaxID=1735272 RepID=UPI001B88877F|nr:uncharacterized protein LOC121382093 isoform X1 [Gigantopelta aegis]